MSLLFTIGTLLLTFLISKLIYGRITGQKKPLDLPGPRGWPLVGNSLQMDFSCPYKTLSEWSEVYGNMFRVRIFKDDVVVLNDYQSIQEMLSSDACSSRPYMYRVRGIVMREWTGFISHVYDPEWYERKKTLTRSLNAYGTGLSRIESVTMISIDKMLADVAEQTNRYSRSIDMRPLVHQCTVSIISTLFYGRQLGQSELMELLQLERGLVKLFPPAGLITILDILPWMRHVPLEGIQGPIRDTVKMRQWIAERHSVELDTDATVENQGVLQTLSQSVNRVTNKVMTRGELQGMTIDIITAGFITSTASLYSLILALINYPEVQEKMCDEIQRVTRGKRPQVSDRSSMPYVRAVMEENFRYSTNAPLAMPHHTTQATTINGKYIPEGTSLLANFWKYNHDERYFEDPWEFKPERFLSPSGQLLPREEAVWKYSMPFGAGKRVCPGEGLARNRIFLIVTCLIQKYKFLPEDEQNIPSCDPRGYDSGLVLIPQMYKVKIVERG